MTKVAERRDSESWSDGEDERDWEDDEDSPQEEQLSSMEKKTRHYSSRLIIEPLRVFKDRSLQQSIRNVIRKNIVQLLQTDKVEQELVRIVERKVDKRQNHPEEYEELQKRLKWFKTLIQSYKGLRKRLQKYYSKITAQAQEGKGNLQFHAQLQQQILAQQQRASAHKASPNHRVHEAPNHYMPRHQEPVTGESYATPPVRRSNSPVSTNGPMRLREEPLSSSRLSPLRVEVEGPEDGGIPSKRSNSPVPPRTSTIDNHHNTLKRAAPMTPLLPSLSSLFPNLPPPTPSAIKPSPSMLSSLDILPPAKRPMLTPPSPSSPPSMHSIPPMSPMSSMPLAPYNRVPYGPFLQGMPQQHMMQHPMDMPLPRHSVFPGMPQILPPVWAGRDWR